MDPQKMGILTGAFRAVMAGALGYFTTHGYISSELLNDILMFVGCAVIVTWSYLDKQGDAQKLFPSLMGPARNLGVALLTFAAGRGWITSADIGPMMGGVTVLVATLWSSESKVLSIKKYGNMLILALMIPMFLMGCATTLTPQEALDTADGVYIAAKTEYAAFCQSSLGQTQSICTADAQMRERKAVSVADLAFKTAQDAINAGHLDQNSLFALIDDAIQAAVLVEGWGDQAASLKRAHETRTLWDRVTSPRL